MSRFDVIAGRLVEAWGPTLTKDFYLPRNADKVEKVTPEGTDVEGYYYEKGGASFGMAFWGKGNKPVWHFRFRSREDFDKRLAELASTNKSHKERVEQRKQERLNYRHDYKVGDILYSSWGYDQTNIDFYQVTEVKEKSVKIREIGSKRSGGDSVVAAPGTFKGPEMTKVVGPGGRVRITSYASAGKWDGRAMYETPFGMGH